MKKLLSIMLVLTMALTLLAGCGGSGGKLRLHGWQLFGAR